MPNKRVILIEDHHEALREWTKLKIKDAPLVHLDAHIDFGFYQAKPAIKAFEEARDVADLKRQLELSLLFESRKRKFEDQLNIGNYIYPAMRDEIVDSFRWIIPGGKKEFSGSEKILRRMVKNLKSRDPHKHPDKLYNKDFAVSDVYSVKKHNLPVLLDVDVDYLLFDSLKKTSLTKRIGERKPWLYPDKLAKLLKKKFPKRICTTIAYSVNGGFTPILYKFFGDEIALRLKTTRLSRKLEKVFVLRNKAIASYSKNDQEGSFKHASEAVRLLGKAENIAKDFRRKFFAHLNLWLYNICWDKKEEARAYYGEAVLNDPTLRVVDNNFGWLYLSKRRTEAARREFERIVYCDPLDHNALRGLGDIDFSRQKYEEAKISYNEALKLKSDDKRALAGLAECHLRLGDLTGAKNILEKLKKIDPINGRVYRMEAELCVKKGELKKALSLYKEAAMLGPNSPDMYKEVFGILKTEKDKELSHFFRIRYNAIKKRRRPR